MGNYVKEMTLRGIPQSLVMKRWGRREAALHDHTIALSSRTMANRAVDIEPIATPKNLATTNLVRETSNQLPIYAAGEEKVVVSSQATRNRVRNQWPGRAAIREKQILLQRLQPRVIAHFLTARRAKKDQ
jgi:hypothetical protein